MKKKQVIAVGVGVIVIFILFFSNSIGSLFSPEIDRDLNLSNIDIAGAGNNDSDQGQEIKSNNLIIEDIVLGSGLQALNGKILTVHYTGTLSDGTVFDSSRDRGTPFTFTLGVGQVILGWEEGFDGMKVGGQRKLTIPPEMGYGANSFGPIPANSTLIFEVELLEVNDL